MTGEKEIVCSLPRGWARIILDTYMDIAARIGWRGLKKEEYLSHGPLLLAVKDIREDGSINYDVTDHLSEFRYNESPEIQLRAQDILVSKDGTIGRIGFVESPPQRVTVNSSILVVRPCSAILPSYLFYYFRGTKFQEIVRERITGSTVPHLFQHDIKKFQLDIPPFNEQKRIVARLEELFTLLDAGVEGLRKVKVQLKRYHQAVLRYAFEGKLTEEWRKTHKDTEPATKLLGRAGAIKQHRKEKTEEKANEKPSIDTLALPQLPENWTWAKLSDVTHNVSLAGRKLQQKQYKDAGRIPVIDQGRKFIGGYTDREELKVNVEAPMIVFGDHTKVFKYVDFNFVAGADGIKVLKPLEAFYPKLFYYFLQAIELPEKGYARHFQFLEKSFIPLPPVNEQKPIVEEIESRFSVIDELGKASEQSLKQSERLSQSILGKAFEGKLVPQDPDDEPADKLLEHVREERAKSTHEKDTNRKKIKLKQLELSTYVK